MTVPRSALASALVLLLLAGGCRQSGGARNGALPDHVSDERPLDQRTLAPLVRRTAPAVVNIAVLQASPAEQNPLLRDPFFRQYFGIPAEQAEAPKIAAGSGVIVDGRRGIVLTNNHVIEGAKAIEVALLDRRRFEAELVGTDKATDIAVLRIRGSGLPQLALGDSDRLQVGDYVVAIGNPFQLGQTVTAGIVSALGRGLGREGYQSYIQTDAPIDPGNSGGPLIALDGSVIEIEQRDLWPGRDIAGIGFAVPSTTARFVMQQNSRVWRGAARPDRCGHYRCVASAGRLCGSRERRAHRRGCLGLASRLGAPAAQAISSLQQTARQPPRLPRCSTRSALPKPGSA